MTQIPSTISSVHDAANVLATFLSRSKKGSALLTGAGISVPSGIPDYRGTSGTYVVNKTYRPIFFNEFRERHASRQRYWARSFLGYPPVSVARPNLIHETVAAMLDEKIFSSLITQNVDGLHTFHHPHVKSRTTEIHGSLHRVVCLDCHGSLHRQTVQDRMRELNPAWTATAAALGGGGRQLKTNPDGDVDMPRGVTYETFRYPPCPTCLSRGVAKVDDDGAWISGSGVLKPSVVFFGESVPPENKDASDRALEEADGLVCIGTSLAVYSAFRFIKAARAQGKPIAILNEGHVRDEEKWIDGALGDIRINMNAEKVLPLAFQIMQARH